MMEKMLSIIVPSYNMEKYLPKCLGSLVVAPELMEKLEVLVVNDGSKDRTSEIAHEFAAKWPGAFRVIDKANGHYGSCINAALAEARGKFIRVLDADDWFDTDCFARYLERLLSLNSSGEDVDVIISGYRAVQPDGTERKCSCWGLPAEGTFGFKTLAEQDHVPIMHETTYRTQIFKDIGYRQTEGIMYTDTEWMFRPMLNVRRCAYCPEIVYQYLVGREGQSIDKKTQLKGLGQQIRVLGNIVDVYLACKSESSAEQLRYMEMYILRIFNFLFYITYCHAPINLLQTVFYPICKKVQKLVEPSLMPMPAVPILKIDTSMHWLNARFGAILFPLIFRADNRLHKWLGRDCYD